MQNQSVGLGKHILNASVLYPSTDRHVHPTYFNMFKLFPLLIFIQTIHTIFCRNLCAHTPPISTYVSHMYIITKKNEWPNIYKGKSLQIIRRHVSLAYYMKHSPAVCQSRTRVCMCACCSTLLYAKPLSSILTPEQTEPSPAVWQDLLDRGAFNLITP